MYCAHKNCQVQIHYQYERNAAKIFGTHRVHSSIDKEQLVADERFDQLINKMARDPNCSLKPKQIFNECRKQIKTQHVNFIVPDDKWIKHSKNAIKNRRAELRSE